jgi:hypothetical protein
MTFSTKICKPILRRKHIFNNIACGVDQISLVSELSVCLSNIESSIMHNIFLWYCRQDIKLQIYGYAAYILTVSNSLLFLSLFLFHLSSSITEGFVKCAPYGSLMTFSESSKNILCNGRVFNFTKIFKSYFISLPKFKNVIVEFTAYSNNRVQ